MSSLANASAGIIQAELGNLYDTQPFIKKKNLTNKISLQGGARSCTRVSLAPWPFANRGSLTASLQRWPRRAIPSTSMTS
jgi:hypothetical protein